MKLTYLGDKYEYYRFCSDVDLIWFGGILFLEDRNDYSMKNAFWPFYLGQYLAEYAEDEINGIQK